MLDVLVIGGGMCGQTVAFALARDGVRNVRIIDRAARGGEGPWGTYARMDTLRSPKQLAGPDLGVPSLTYRAWHEAKFGARHWNKLHKIAPRRYNPKGEAWLPAARHTTWACWRVHHLPPWTSSTRTRRPSPSTCPCSPECHPQ